MNKKLTVLLLLFIFTTVGLFGYIYYLDKKPQITHYIKETELEEISTDDKLVFSALSSLSFNYNHKKSTIEDRIYKDDLIKVDDLEPSEKLLIIINDLNQNYKLPLNCTNNSIVFQKKDLTNSIIRDTSFLKKIENKELFIGPYKVRYKDGYLLIINNYCDINISEYSKLEATSAKKSNKRLIINANYTYIKEPKKEVVAIEEEIEPTPKIEETTPIQIEFQIINNKLFFKQISK